MPAEKQVPSTENDKGRVITVLRRPVGSAVQTPPEPPPPALSATERKAAILSSLPGRLIDLSKSSGVNYKSTQWIIKEFVAVGSVSRGPGNVYSMTPAPSVELAPVVQPVEDVVFDIDLPQPPSPTPESEATALILEAIDTLCDRMTAIEQNTPAGAATIRNRMIEKVMQECRIDGTSVYLPYRVDDWQGLCAAFGSIGGKWNGKKAALGAFVFRDDPAPRLKEGIEAARIGLWPKPQAKKPESQACLVLEDAAPPPVLAATSNPPKQLTAKYHLVSSGIDCEDPRGQELVCPYCADLYVTFRSPKEVMGEENEVWAGRGGWAIKIPMECESGHEWTCVIGSHQGQAYIAVEGLMEQDPPFEPHVCK